MKNTYWNNNGRCQQDLDRISELMPDYSYTDNNYMNLFITVSKIYYRKYNDGDSIFDFEEIVSKYIEPFSEEIKFNPFIEYEGQDLEKLVDNTIEFIKDKDLTFNSSERV